MKCSSCGSTMTYDVASYGLVCDHCGAKRQLHRPEEGTAVGEVDFASALRGAGTNWGVSRRLVTCKCCGASMLFAPEQMSELCPFCGSAIVLTPEEADCGIAPNAMIPFSITKEEVTDYTGAKTSVKTELYYYKTEDMPDYEYYEDGNLKISIVYSSKTAYTKQIFFDEDFSVKTYYDEDKKIRDEYYNGDTFVREKIYE